MTQLLEDLPRAAHTHVLLQARDLLARAGTVEALELELLGSDALCVRGTVIAPHGARFHPSIEWHPADRQRFQHGLCLCPTQPGRPCLHQCVLLLAVAGAIDHQPGRGITGVDEWMVRRWLEGVERAAQPSASAAPAARQLLYLLQPQAAGVRLELWSGRPRKQGGFGHLQRLQGLEPPPWVEPLDRSILALLAAHPAAGEGGEALAGEPGGDLVALLLRSERLFWASAEQPLAGAGLRGGQLDWREDTQGAFPVLLDDSRQPLWLLPTEPPYYIDAHEFLIGPLSLSEPVPVVEKLLASPHFSPIAQRALVGDFATLAARGTLPLPPAIHTRELQGATPRPVLRLDSRQMLLWGRRGQERRTVHSASAWFDYASERVPALPAAATLVRVVDGEVLQLRRDSALEAEYLARLRDFEPLAAQRVVQTPAPPPNVFTLADADDWLDAMTDLIPRLEAEGWRIEYAPTFQLRPLEIEGWYGEAEEGSSTDWFELNLGILHEGRRIDLLPLLVSALRRLPALDQRALLQLPDDATFPVFAAGGVFQLPLARLRPILQTLVELFDHEDSPLDDRGRLRLARLDAARLVDLDLPWLAGDRLLALGRQLRDFSGIAPVPPPAGLQAELRGYQREGLDWLCFLREFGFAGILADDMGLGKTVQTLALLQHERERHPGSGPSLLVAPTSLLHNWRREAARFAPGLKVVVLHGLDRAALWREAEQADLVITSYSLLPRDEGRLSARQWHYLVFDEAQYLKNPRAKATEVARRLQAGHRLALTGTPMENHLGELWSIFDVLMPHFLGSEARFRRLYRLPVERQGDEQRRQQLASRVAPFLLRRTKEQVAAELPPKTEIVRAVMLEGAQRDLYETIRLAMDEKVRAEVASKGLARSHIVVLEALLKLRQVCCDPRLVKLAQAGRVKQSAKLELLMELLPELLEEGRRVLLFSQFTSMLALIQQALDARGIPYVTLTGDTVDRVTPVDRFQSGEVPLFLISLKAGGVGLNLTAADTVIHYDPWWNPAVERQATDRAHRIGQDKPVFVYKLITEGTVEEKILELQGRKAALAEGVYGQNSELASQLDAADLSALLGPLS